MPAGESPEIIETLAAGERGAPPADSDPLILLTSFDDVRVATLRAAQGAKRVLSLYTKQLEPQLYEDSVFLDVLKGFLLARSYSRVRILLHEPLHQAGNSSRLLTLSRRLTTYMELRPVTEEFRHRHSAMLIADDKAIVYRPSVASWEGVAGFNQTSVARLHLQEFDQMWLASAPLSDSQQVAYAS